MAEILKLTAAAVVLHVVLAFPNFPAGLSAATFLRWQWELPFILALLLVVSRNAWVLRGLFFVLLGTVFVFKIADIATFNAFNRPFSVVLDVHLLSAGINLLTRSVGGVMGWAMIAGSIFGFVAVLVLILWAMRIWSGLMINAPARIAAWGIAGLSMALTLADTGHATKIWTLPANPPGTATTTRVGYWHARKTITASAELTTFMAAAKTDPYANSTGLLGRIGQRDVWIIYVESYGRASFDNPIYSPTHTATLTRAQDRLASEGYAMRSGWLNAPVEGGQSWLAHTTLSSGLEVGDQARYAAALASPRKTLFHIAQASGFRTSAVMPAITIAWPESDLMGFDDILAAEDLNYRGKPFNWVTMPDQYTLSVFDELLPQDTKPRFVQMALISSHAPWVPIPEMIAWEDVGDGTVFNKFAEAGDTPKVVWRDRDRVRDQYRRAIDYALQAVTEHAARQQTKPIIFVLGDHPAAGFVSQVPNRHVPVHMIAEPEIAGLINAWDWSDGLIPASDTAVWGMESFRDRFIAAFSSGASAG